MLPTFVIGLREGLEAALIVGIIAAFLGKQGRRDLLRWVFVGVAVAILLCVGVGVALKVVSEDLPQKQQEGLETIVGILAVGMVTYMVIWMRRHSRDLKGQLEGLAAEAIDSGADDSNRAARAMVLMAFLAVLREGFETVVFLLAAFNETSNSAAAGTGAVLGILLAMALGYGIYRGGVRINLSKFFRATGLVLVLVAAGLVVNALHTAHEAGWLNAGQGATVDLTWLVRPGSVQSSLLTGMLGIQPNPVVIEVIGWFAYLIPVGLYVAWPPGRSIPSRVLARLYALGAVVAGVLAIGCAVAAPAAPPKNPTTVSGPLSATVLGNVRDDVTLRTQQVSPAGNPQIGGPAELRLRRSGSGQQHAGVATDVYTAKVQGTGASGRPTQLDTAQLAALNGGRLPLGLRLTGSQTVQVRYTDTTAVTAWIAPQTGRVVDLRWVGGVQAEVVDSAVGVVPLPDVVPDKVVAFAPTDVSAASASAHRDSDRIDSRRAQFAWAWIFTALAVLALGCLGVVALRSRRRREAAVVDESRDPVPAS